MNNSFQTKKISPIDIKEKIKVFIKDDCLIDLSTFGDNDSFLRRSILDSTGVLELVSFIEAAFRIKVEDEELTPDNLDSLNKIVNYVSKKMANAD